jgi:hypothetical protein
VEFPQLIDSDSKNELWHVFGEVAIEIIHPMKVLNYEKLKPLFMKSFLGTVILISTILLSSFRTAALSDTIEIDDIVVALKAGNASNLSKYFDSRVDLSLPDKSDNYSRIQAEMIIKDFFSNNGVRNFELKHKGEKSGSNYCVGILQTRGGNYRTTLFMKWKGDKQYLQDISFQQLD